MPYTFPQPYALDGTEGQTINVFQSTDLVTPLTSFTSDANGRGFVSLTVSDTTATTLYFVRASDSKRLAVVTVEPREIASLQAPALDSQKRVTVGTNSDKSGYSLATAPPTATQVRQELDANSTKLANLDTTVSSRSNHSATDVWNSPTRLLSGFGFTVNTNANTTETAIKAKTDLLPASPAATGDIPSAATIAGAVWGAGSRTLTGFGSLVSDVVSGVWGAASRTLSGFGFTVNTNPNSTETAIKAKTDLLPASPASTSDVQVTVPAPVVNLPAPVVNPTLTAGQVAQLDAIAGNVAPLGSMIEDGAFTAGALVNAPVGEGGGGGAGGYTNSDRARDVQTAEDVATVRERLAEQVAEPGPVIALPAYVPPAGRVRVLLRPTFLGELTEATVQVFYLDKTTPVLSGGVEMVTHYATFKKDAEKFGPYYGLEMPVGDVVYFANDKNAALTKGTGAFQVTDDGTGARFLDELISAYEG